MIFVVGGGGLLSATASPAACLDRHARKLPTAAATAQKKADGLTNEAIRGVRSERASERRIEELITERRVCNKLQKSDRAGRKPAPLGGRASYVYSLENAHFARMLLPPSSTSTLASLRDICSAGREDFSSHVRSSPSFYGRLITGSAGRELTFMAMHSILLSGNDYYTCC